MEMRWKDLEKGDILCFNPEFEPAFSEEYGRRPSFHRMIDRYENDFFFVKEIIDTSDDDGMVKIIIDVNSDRDNGYRIVEENGALYKLKGGPSVFLVCGLAR